MMEKTKEEQRTSIPKSLGVTLFAGGAFLLLFVYGAVGFLMFHYFRENPGRDAQPVAEQSMEMSLDEAEKVQSHTHGTVSPQLEQPAFENINAYTNSESLMEKSLEQITSLRRSVVMIEAGENKGSGVVISDQGYVITNLHVIEASPYTAIATVETLAGETVKRELMLLGYDKRKDLALLQFKNARELPLQSLPLGNIGSVLEGQRIVTIGSPDGLINTVTEGIVSGIRRFDSETYVQLSVLLSPDISGGALLNMKGELIGLTTSKISEPENLNYAISVDEVKELIDANPHWVNP